MAPAQPNLSILRGFVILEEVISSSKPLGSREISRSLGLEHSSVNRILGTLCEIGMLRQNQERKYLPGPHVHFLATLSLHASGLIRASLAVLDPFTQLGAIVAVGTVWRDNVIYLLHSAANADLASSAGVHDHYPRNKSIIGKVLSPDFPDCTYEDRPDVKTRAWGAKIGSHEFGLAVVLPLNHPKAEPPQTMLSLTEEAAEEINRRIYG